MSSRVCGALCGSTLLLCTSKERQIGRSGMMKIWEKVHENSLSRKPPREMSSCGLPWASRCEAKDSNGFRHCHAVMHMKGAHMKDVSSSFKMFFLLTGNNEKIWKNIENPLKRNQLFPATFSLFNRHFCRGYFHRNLLCRSQHSAAAEIPCRPCRRRDSRVHVLQHDENVVWHLQNKCLKSFADVPM